MKKGQVTLFIIIRLLLLFLTAFALYLYVQSQPRQTDQAPCAGSTTPQISINAESKQQQSNTYQYKYTYVITACNGAVLADAYLQYGTQKEVIQSTSVQQGQRFRESNTHTSTGNFTQLCITVSDTSVSQPVCQSFP